MTKVNPTNKAAYKRHEYSGPRKSRKKVQAALKRLHGSSSDKFYRVEAWRKKEQKEVQQTMNCPIMDSQQQKEVEQINCCPIMESPNITEDVDPLSTLSTAQETPKIKTYSRAISNINYEATACCNAVGTVSVQEEASDIDWPQSDPETEASQPTVERTSDKLSGLTGYRYVDLRHVIQWAFHMERHRQTCESSQIDFVSEQRKGLHSVLTFKCSKCDKTWQQHTEKEQ